MRAGATAHFPAPSMWMASREPHTPRSHSPPTSCFVADRSLRLDLGLVQIPEVPPAGVVRSVAVRGGRGGDHAGRCTRCSAALIVCRYLDISPVLPVSSDALTSPSTDTLSAPAAPSLKLTLEPRTASRLDSPRTCGPARSSWTRGGWRGTRDTAVTRRRQTHPRAAGSRDDTGGTKRQACLYT
ncbi:hypothetical protein C8R44DRAFT_892358 [Mycena epipterygia]|nr:hypothetical protein C8R44DRAFT_892358 [Mycena epipterygia]